MGSLRLDLSYNIVLNYTYKDEFYIPSMQIAILLGTSYSSLPILKNLKKLNLFVIACGNNPKDVCVSLADEYIKIDYSNKQKLYLKLKERKFDFLIPSCNDFAYISGSYIAEKLCLPGYDSHKVANKIFQKNYFRKFLIKNKGLDKRFTEFGGKIDDKNSRFIPTLETLTFLFYGNEVEAKFQAQNLYNEHHVFNRNTFIIIIDNNIWNDTIDVFTICRTICRN